MSKPVRLPDYLHAEIERLAAEEKRSLANMVKVLLEQALKMDGSLSERGQQQPPHKARGSAQAEQPDRRATTSDRKPRSESDPHFKPDFK